MSPTYERKCRYQIKISSYATPDGLLGGSVTYGSLRSTNILYLHELIDDRKQALQWSFDLSYTHAYAYAVYSPRQIRTCVHT